MRVDVLVVAGSAAPQWHSYQCADAEDARARAVADGFTPLSTKTRNGLLGRLPGLLPAGGSRFDLDVFCSQLTVLLGAGLGVVEGLQILQQNARQTEQRAVLSDLILRLEAGHSFAEATQMQGERFPMLFVAMLRSAERTSNLADALERYIAYQRQSDEVRSKIRSALIYPAFLMVVGSIVICFLMMYVIPRFAGVYETVRVDLPWAARWMLAWGHAIKQYGLVVGCVVAVLVTGVAGLFSAPSFRARIWRSIQQIPGIGELIRRSHLGRLYRTLAMLVSGGIPVLGALQISAGLLPAMMRAELAGSASAVSQGSTLSAALRDHQLVTPVAFNLLAVGERSGELGTMLDESARFIELETARVLDRAMRVFEPALMTFIGLVIGVIVILMYLPIFELAGSMQ